MSANVRNPHPLFDHRESGILLHLTSLPSPYGIGDLGPSAISWIDCLEQAGQTWWQILPLGPTGYGNSPYQPLSSFACNSLLISPDWLIEDELLRPDDCVHDPFPTAAVDYDAVAAFKGRLLQKAWSRFKISGQGDLQVAYQRFCEDQKHWLGDYALFRVLKVKFANAHYLAWPAELVERTPPALDHEYREFADEINQERFAQFLFFRQTEKLKAYAHSKGLRLIGDLPFFVSSDSSDVWSRPELFLLDERRRPRFVAGVPPDYFSAQGQLWGDPLYNWEYLRQSDYEWSIARVRSLLAHVDIIRLDHFRGFVAAWHVPADAPTAQTGSWVPGPVAELFQALWKELGALPFIAEDLGMITPDVYALRDQFHLPGMRVLQFAFDGHADNPYLLENFVENTVAYTGTHDNSTAHGWFEDLPNDQRERFSSYLASHEIKESVAAHALMELAWSSTAELTIAPLQDVLNLGNEARINVPGRPDGNWRWRCSKELLSDKAFEWLRDLTRKTNRSIAPMASDSKVFQMSSRA